MSNINTVNARNIRPCTCLQCGAAIAPGEGYSAPLASNGGRAQSVCWNCKQGYNDISYGQHAHAAATGKQAKSGLTYSVELELREVDVLTRGEMAAAGFIATKDSTTEVEYKMPPRGNLNNAKTWSTVEALLMHGHAEITDSEGSHIHIGHGTVEIKDEDGNPTPGLINYRTMRKIRVRAHTMLDPLMNEWHANPAAVVRVFGRYFDMDYAIGQVSSADRYSAINITNDNTIEYRLPRFRTAAQYRNCLKLCADLTKTIVTNYCKYAQDLSTHPRKLDHKAEITAQKLVKVWRKYEEAAPSWKDANCETDTEVAARIW